MILLAVSVPSCSLHTAPCAGFPFGSQLQHGARIMGWFRLEEIVSFQPLARGRDTFRGDLLAVTPQGTAVAGDTQRGHRAPSPAPAAGDNRDFNVLNNTAVPGTHGALTSRGGCSPVTIVLSLLRQLLPPDNARLQTWSCPGSTFPAGGAG